MRATRLGVLALGACNRRSVIAGLERAGAAVDSIEAAQGIEGVDALVLPGVAHFGFVARALDELAVRDAVVEAIRAGLPVLGICAGFQLFFEGSDEAPGVPGLGIFPGRVRRLRGPKSQHIGWNQVVPNAGGEVEGWAYFAHAYAPPADVVSSYASTTYGEPFTSMSRAEAVTGVQFHPERSGEYGARVLAAFVNSVRPAYVG